MTMLSSSRPQRAISTILVSFSFLIVLIVGTYHLSESPGIWFDEGMYSQTALNLEKYGIQTLQVAPGEFVSAGSVTGGYPFIAPIALSYKLFGVGVTQGRAVMALFILVFAALSFFFIRALFGSAYGSLTLILLSSFAMLYGNGKSVLGEVPGLFFLMCGLLALFSFEQKGYRGIWGAVTLGLFMGFCVATKPIFILLLPALALVWLIRRKEVQVRVGEFCCGMFAFLVPLGIWLYFQFGAGDTLANLLSFYANPYSVPDLPALLIANLQRFVTDTTALYTLVLIGTWSLALVVRWKKKNQISIAELAAFLFSIIVLLASLRLPGWNRYIFPATTIALLFFPFSFLYVFARARERLSFLARISWAPYVLLGFMFAGQMYQVVFSSYVADYYHAHRTHDVQEALAALGTESSIFVYNVPEVVVLLPSSNYYQFIKPYADNDEAVAGVDQLSVLSRAETDYVIAGSDDAASSPYVSSYHLLKKVNRYSILQKN